MHEESARQKQEANMTSSGPTAAVCDWVCSTRYEDIPEDVRSEALKILYDEVGAMIAGSTLDSCKPIVDMVKKLGGTAECTIVGHPLRAPLLNAVLANGAIGHADEVDPTSVHGAGHFAATMVPTALTVGQYVKAPGQTFIRAFILGAEIAARMQSALNSHEMRAGFYYSAGAALGAAATAGLLLGLDADRMEHALGAAAMGCAPLMSLHHEDLHQTKALAYSGRTARAGVESALLAQNDFHSPREILTTDSGFFDAFTGNREIGHEVAADLGRKYLMKDLLYKRYSVGGPNLAPLHALLELMKGHKLTGEHIEQIEVTGAGGRQVGLNDRHPSIHTETVLGLAACYGEYTFQHAHDLSYCNSPRYLDFMKKTKVIIVPRKGPSVRAHRLEAKMTVHARDGRVIEQAVNYPLMTQAELEHKFHALVSARLGAARTHELDRKLKGIADAADVASLVDGLAA
jgi:2-methylcitrate dehydratase PrpD